MNIDVNVRAGHLKLVGHYSNLQHVFIIIGQSSALRASYAGEEDGWHKFFVPALQLHVYARRVDGPAAAYLPKDFSK